MVDGMGRDTGNAEAVQRVLSTRVLAVASHNHRPDRRHALTV